MPQESVITPLDPTMVEHWEDTMKIDFKQKEFGGNFLVHAFDDHGHKVLYMPSLNLSAYGDTNQEAFDMLRMVVNDYFNALFAVPQRTAWTELKKLGWEQKVTYLPKLLKNAAYVDAEGVLRNFELSEETLVEQLQMAV
jgi:hypothetical protein